MLFTDVLCSSLERALMLFRNAGAVVGRPAATEVLHNGLECEVIY